MSDRRDRRQKGIKENEKGSVHRYANRHEGNDTNKINKMPRVRDGSRVEDAVIIIKNDKNN